MGRILAFDYGTRRTGVAVSDPLQMFAQPLDTIPTENLAHWLHRYLMSESVEAFVVGIPSRFDGSDTHASEPVRLFIQALKGAYPDIPVYTMDERLSSREASNSLLQSGVSKKRRQDKKLLDTVSAALILQTYLQSRS
ncbi:MAG: Holliday junction resolvase RuvX [Bacteroidetes bacterium]|nr:Holliday junction resolvase RuvX [Bacteroidota bacterium]